MASDSNTPAKVPDSLLQVARWDGPGYQPVVDFGSWRTALMNFKPGYRADALHTMEAHRETDEVFVLLHGQCTLFFGEPGEDGFIHEVYARHMMPGQVYNVRKGAFHTHALSEDAAVLVVENADTGDHNTAFCALSVSGRKHLMALYRQFG